MHLIKKKYVSSEEVEIINLYKSETLYSFLINVSIVLKLLESQIRFYGRTYAHSDRR